MTTTPAPHERSTPSYPLSWQAVDEACAAVHGVPHADEVELWIHDAREAVAQLVPATGRTTAAAGGAFGAACRLWHGDGFGAASRTVSGTDDVDLLVREAAHAASPQRATARPTPEPTTDDAPRVQPDPLDTAASERLVHETAARLRAVGADVQVVLAQQYQWITSTATGSGLRRSHYHEQTRVLVRCETRHGALLEAAEAQQITADPGIDALVRRITAALDALDDPDCPDALDCPAAPPPPGLPVVLRPQVAAPLVAGLSWLLSGTTALSTPGLEQAVGRRLFPSCLHVDDVPDAHPDGPPMTFDDEGQPARPVQLVDEGRLVGFLHSWDTARRLGHAPNGRGIRMGVGAQPMPRPIALRVAAAAGSCPTTTSTSTAGWRTSSPCRAQAASR